MIPQTRAGRRQLILDILGRQSVRSQGQLLEILSRDGFAVTQATLSRDLLELGAVKVRDGKTLVYAVPGQGGDRTARVAPGPEEVSSRLRRQCEELLVTARVSANLVVVRTPSGAANYLASALDHADESDIMGTIAGDDTILIITGGPPQARALARRLLALAGRDRAEPVQHPGHPNNGKTRTRTTAEPSRPTPQNPPVVT
ncbi:MAG: transcriptional regulator of arginine metabolism [Actinomycetota bacterium]|nr:transcriptional regulator of arginine metabolism [Actinomycetota bacterium]